MLSKANLEHFQSVNNTSIYLSVLNCRREKHFFHDLTQYQEFQKTMSVSED